jgi:FtsP/CotA-like multicopper oxidase with cupredoxin domain
VAFNTPFWVIASDQGYLPSPVLASKKGLTMCPGERYEILVNFGALPGLGGLVLPGGAADVYMVNNGPAPFPGGLSPQQGMNPDLNVIMKFAVSPANGPGIKSCGQTNGGKARLPVAPASLTWDPSNMAQNLARGAWPSAPGNYSNICMPANPALVVAEPAWAAKDLRSKVTATTTRRQLYLNERVDGLTLAPMGMQLNGVPFEYKVTETPRVGNIEVWDLINLTVDAHPMHPHLVAHQIIQRQNLNVGAYKRALCGSATCQPGPAPGGEMQVVPNPADPLVAALGTTINPVTTASPEGGFKDATQAPPGFVTTIVAKWGARWAGSGDAGFPAGAANAPGTAGCPNGMAGCGGPPWTYETVTSGPYVWHCHINSHEDSEMMRTSLVVGP